MLRSFIPRAAYVAKRGFTTGFARRMAPVPIVVCGRNPEIAKKVREGLMPEYEVIHIILSLSAGTTDLPLLLSSKTPPDAADNYGSQNYASRPLAVAIGGGFDDDMFNQIKEACKEAPSVVWTRTDMSKMGKPPAPGEEELYGTSVAGRVKEKLRELKVGEEGGAVEGVYFF